jgi:hypothetical protein
MFIVASGIGSACSMISVALSRPLIVLNSAIPQPLGENGIGEGEYQESHSR